jgi:hypothetical protein
MIKKIIYITVLFMSVTLSSFSQKSKTTDSLKEFNDLIKRQKDLDRILQTNEYVTSNNLSQLLESNWRSFSGVSIKNGKSTSTSAVLDAKSITVNLSLPQIKPGIFIIPTIAGSSNNGFVSVIAGDKYSRTITGGLNFIFPIRKDFFLFYKTDQKTLLHNDLQILKYDYLHKKLPGDKQHYVNLITEIKRILKESGFYIEDYYSGNYGRHISQDSLSNKHVENLTTYKNDIAILINDGIIDEKITSKMVNDQLKMLSDSLSQKMYMASLKRYLDNTDQVQQKASFSIKAFGWVSGNIKYNQANYFIGDSTSKSLTSSVRDEYISTSLSWNALVYWHENIRTYFSPTIYYSNPHNFSTNNQIHAEGFANYKIGNNVLQKVDKDLTFYQKVPQRLNSIYIEMPLAIYSTEKAIGLDMAIKYGWNDVNNDNFGVRLGALVPLSQGDKNQIVIEPLFRIQKMNQGLSDFWGTHFVLGVNLSIALPKSFFN